jgi:hypothetical protein
VFNWLKRLAALSAIALLAACGGSDDNHPGPLVQVAQGDPRFSSLVEGRIARITPRTSSPATA